MILKYPFLLEIAHQFDIFPTLLVCITKFRKWQNMLVRRNMITRDSRYDSNCVIKVIIYITAGARHITQRFDWYMKSEISDI